MEIKSKYDIVVVGGGSAGCFFAGKVAEAGIKVALIEKKKNEYSWSNIISEYMIDYAEKHDKFTVVIPAMIAGSGISAPRTAKETTLTPA